jgi:hypothetical protein
VTLADYRWLISDSAQPWLELARNELTAGRGTTIGILSKLRKELSGERAHLVVEQTELRKRAQEKFSHASEMFFTRQGLQQATDEQIAAYKAERFPAGGHLADLCCGIGGDLLALAGRGSAIGVDSDPVVALLANANARADGLSSDRCQVLVEDAIQFPVNQKTWHCDPDRRAEGKRATRGELFQPPLSAIEGLLDKSHSAAIKLAPATESPETWRGKAELEWIGSRGECRQQVAWFGDLARDLGKHVATIVDAAGGVSRNVSDGTDLPPAAVRLGRYVYEPHAAILAAKATRSLCTQHRLAPVSAGIAYLTGDSIVRDAALDGFEVLEVLPFDRKQLKAYCREHRIGRLEIKKRGVELDPARLRKEIVGRGNAEVTIIISPIANNSRAIVARRVGTPNGPGDAAYQY